jgi:hypothetical protein
MASQNVNNWAKLADIFEQGAKEMVIEQAEAFQADVKATILDKDIYDTGRMYRSVYRKTVEGSDYNAEDEYIMPEISDEPDEHTAYVAVGAVYGAAQNYGGHGITGRPYWEPSILRAKRRLDGGLVKIANKVREVSL